MEENKMMQHHNIHTIIEQNQENTGTTETENNTETENTPRTFTQADLEAIIDRKIAKERKRAEELEARNAELEKQVKASEQAAKEKEEAIAKAKEEGIAYGQLQSEKNRVAKQYGLSAEFLPNDEESLKKYEAELNAAITSKRRVQPVEITPKTNLPEWVSRVH